MRIVGGQWRGRAIEAPEGRDVTRPTTDRTREAMASMVLSAFDLDLSNVAVLDAFAGSGAIGLELLSRGARSCLFVDADRAAASRVRRNVRSLGASDAQARVVCTDICRLAARGRVSGGPFGLVVLDPPYAMPAAQVAQLVNDLRSRGSLVRDALVLYERASRGSGLELVSAETIKTRRRGQTSTDLIRLVDKPRPGEA